ncbi:hypothetical protein [Streptomyces sp. NPDC057636]|uniref:hypothetical protein n=1 Tax=Streptomyces sp. NPDC057636 TaxID=3346189 RepID=UPI0036908E1B
MAGSDTVTSVGRCPDEDLHQTAHLCPHDISVASAKIAEYVVHALVPGPRPVRYCPPGNSPCLLPSSESSKVTGSGIHDGVLDLGAVTAGGRIDVSQEPADLPGAL